MGGIIAWNVFLPSSSSGKPERSERREPGIHAVRIEDVGWHGIGTFWTLCALPFGHGMDPRVSATAIGLLRPRMTKRWVCLFIATPG